MEKWRRQLENNYALLQNDVNLLKERVRMVEKQWGDASQKGLELERRISDLKDELQRHMTALLEVGNDVRELQGGDDDEP